MSKKETNENKLDIVKLAAKHQYARCILVVCAKADAEPLTIPAVNAFKQKVEVVQIENLTEGLEAIKDTHFDVVVHLDQLNLAKGLTAPLAEIAQLNFDCCIVRVNEGNETGKGRKAGGIHQRNEKVAAYVRPISQHFHKFDITLRRDARCVVIAKGRKYYELDDDGEE